MEVSQIMSVIAGDCYYFEQRALLLNSGEMFINISIEVLKMLLKC